MKCWLVPLLSLLVVACGNASADEDAVRETFEAYRVSLIDRDGDAAVALISGSTIAYYDGVRSLALYADAEALTDSTLIDRLSVYKYRAEWTGPELQMLSAGDVFVYAVDNGWVGSNLGALDLASIRVFGDSATTTLSNAGQALPWGFTFHREDDSWRIDLASLMTVMNAAMTQQIDQLDVTELEFVDYFLRSSGYSGGADERILNPLLVPESE